MLPTCCERNVAHDVAHDVAHNFAYDLAHDLAHDLAQLTESRATVPPCAHPPTNPLPIAWPMADKTKLRDERSNAISKNTIRMFTSATEENNNITLRLILEA